jgi:hypothetical protein
MYSSKSFKMCMAQGWVIIVKEVVVILVSIPIVAIKPIHVKF